MPFKSPIQPLEGITVTIVPTHHGVPSCGYHFETNRKRGRFDRERATTLGLSDEQVGQLAQGEDLLVDGQTLTAASFRGEPHPGCSIMISGDTAHGPIGFDAANLPSPPQLLLHEATFLADQQERATQYHHSTASDAARHATSCKASALALTHYSSRIERLSPLVSEAREHFSGGVAATQDGDWFAIDANGDVSHHVRVENGWNKKNL